MGEQLTIALPPKKERRKYKRPLAQPGLEGISWVRCTVCNRPLHDEASKLRKIGNTCFRRQTERRTQANLVRNTKDLANQLPLFTETDSPATVPAAPVSLNEYGF